MEVSFKKVPKTTGSPAVSVRLYFTRAKDFDLSTWTFMEGYSVLVFLFIYEIKLL